MGSERCGARWSWWCERRVISTVIFYHTRLHILTLKRLICPRPHFSSHCLRHSRFIFSCHVSHPSLSFHVMHLCYHWSYVNLSWCYNSFKVWGEAGSNLLQDNWYHCLIGQYWLFLSFCAIKIIYMWTVGDICIDIYYILMLVIFVLWFLFMTHFFLLHGYCRVSKY